MSTQDATNGSTGSVNVYGGLSVQQNAIIGMGLTVQNISIGAFTSASGYINNLTVGNMSITGTLTTVNVTTTNLIDTNITSGNANVNNMTVANLLNTNISSSTLNLSIGITTSNLNATAVTITNMIGTNVSASTLNLSTGFSSASAQLTNAGITNSTITNLIVSALSSNTVSGGMIASASQTLSGSSTNQVISPASFSGNKSISTNGYYAFPGGLYIQWFSVSTNINGSTLSTNFPVSFPNACVNVQLNYSCASGSNSNFIIITTGFNKNSVSWYWQAISSINGNGVSVTVYGFAIGY